MKVSKNTIYKGIRELRTGDAPGKGRIRRQGGGRKNLLSEHPEWIDALKAVIEPHTELFFMNSYTNGITSSSRHNLYQVIF